LSPLSSGDNEKRRVVTPLTAGVSSSTRSSDPARAGRRGLASRRHWHRLGEGV